MINLQITNVLPEDIDLVFTRYAEAAAHQRRIGTVVVWPEFDRSMVAREISENHQWKLLIDGEMACVWATTFSDEQIWEARNVDPSLYIHRIATNPAFRGHNFVETIVSWAKEHARLNHKKFVRLDTLGNNTRLIDHYTGAGFTFLGMFELKDTTGLPAHYSKEPACLFQLAV